MNRIRPYNKFFRYSALLILANYVILQVCNFLQYNEALHAAALGIVVASGVSRLRFVTQGKLNRYEYLICMLMNLSALYFWYIIAVDTFLA